MKSVLILLAILSTGCATASNPTTAELDWREGEVTGQAYGLPYTFEGDELTFHLYKHGEPGDWRGKHDLHIEDDEIKYRLKYVF